MQIVKDANGRPWTINVTAASANRVFDLVRVEDSATVPQPDGTVVRTTTSTPFNIADVSVLADTLTTLRNRLVICGETLYAICKPQADAQNVSREDFLDALAGDSLDAMHDALVDELIEFFPSSVRAMAKLLRDKMGQVNDSLIKAAEQHIASVSAADTADVINAQAGPRPSRRNRKPRVARIGGDA